jgi:hypothetical protein
MLNFSAYMDEMTMTIEAPVSGKVRVLPSLMAMATSAKQILTLSLKAH